MVVAAAGVRWKAVGVRLTGRRHRGGGGDVSASVRLSGDEIIRVHKMLTCYYWHDDQRKYRPTAMVSEHLPPPPPESYRGLHDVPSKQNCPDPSPHID